MELNALNKQFQTLQKKENLKRRDAMKLANNIVKLINEFIQTNKPKGQELVDLYKKAGNAYQIASTKVPLNDRDNVAFPSNYWIMRSEQVATTLTQPIMIDNYKIEEGDNALQDNLSAINEFIFLSQNDISKNLIISNKAVPMNIELYDVIISMKFRNVFKLFVNSNDSIEREKMLKSVEGFLNNSEAENIFRNELNIDYFMNFVLKKVFELDLVDSFEKINVVIDVSLVDNYKSDDCCEMLIFIGFSMKFLNLDLNPTYIKKYISFGLKKAAINWKMMRNSQYEYMKKKEKEFNKLINKFNYRKGDLDGI